ncbi:Cytochrome c oxidase subunit 5B, mitochondrial [Microsporum canis]|uniref:Cytochrome c oxidase polypeptide V n=1 Tax=Arthroderma otae (strain ATCC MYA-4605 / CBS 113480) TaxID=554155 RepID=C5FVR5_ARTOC|nr:cytochrome c oxidase polypeptide V [Microsporum canis CBS 113480]EEQ33999.1 cytochrome c oxidase polypeptide V [Microsporum canis CBS 113480]
MSFRATPRAVAGTVRSVSTTCSKTAVRSNVSSIGCLNARVPVNNQPASLSKQQIRSASSEHAIANPVLAGIEKRWEAMPPQDQAELWMKLRDRMKVDWKEMTLQEKRAAYWIAFGPHGPRAETPKGEGAKIFIQVMKYVVISAGLFYATRLLAGAPPKTMTKEWQEATNEYARKEKLDPIYGISSEGYSGKGFVQSPPAGK